MTSPAAPPVAKVSPWRTILPFVVMGGLVVITGFSQSWNVAFAILNLSVISAIMALGINMQWGYAGLVNFGVMGFTALGGMAVILIAADPVDDAWAAGGAGVLLGLLVLIAVGACTYALRKMLGGWIKTAVTLVVIGAGLYAASTFFGPSIDRIEDINPAETGFLGGLGLPVLLSWIAGGFLAAGAAFVLGKIALGLRADYLAIATLGVSEIVIAFLKNEEWLTRGVKNVIGLPRPVPFETEVREEAWFEQLQATLMMDEVTLSSLVVKGAYIVLFLIVLFIILWLAETALRSPWGRMMRAVRDNEMAAEAMGKDVKRLHLLVFVVGSGVIGLAGAMLTTLDGQFTPTSYQPLRFTFLVWVMVIVGGSGNNWGATLGAFVVWFAWVQAEPVGAWTIDLLTSFLGEDNPVREQLVANAAQMRLMVMGLVLLLVLRFFPRGLIPERQR